MGKRELLLAGVFVVLAVLAYRWTAPPPDPDNPGFSLSRIINEVRREVRGRPASAEGTETQRYAAPASLEEVRVALESGALTITGEDRDDIEAQLHVRSDGYDNAEASELVKATKVIADHAGPLLMLRVDFPPEGRQTATLTLKVPRRLGVRLDQKSGVLEITDVSAVTVGTGRGETKITRVPGAVAVAQRGSKVTVHDVGSLRLNTVSSAEARVSDVKGDAAFNLQGGDLVAENLGGALQVESRSADLRFERIDNVKTPIRINATGGELEIVGLRTEARIDGRGTEIRIELGEPAALGIYNEGDEAIELTLPKAGVRVDAVATEGRVSVDDSLRAAGLTVAGGDAKGEQNERRDERASGTLFGGGPVITLRASGGDILVRQK